MYVVGRSAIGAGLLVVVLSIALAIPVRAADRRASPIAPAVAPAASACAQTTVLYDGAHGGTPDTQGMTYQTDSLAATQTFSNGATIFDTTAQQGIHAGYAIGSQIAAPTLDRTSGYTLTFTLRVLSEAHANANRAGWSVIALSSDKQGIELGFWADHVWAQNDGAAEPPAGTLFTHGEDKAFTTTSGLISYTLAVRAATYTLAADDTTILSGPLRDYTPFVGPIDPYEIPNFVFLGDDTGSARASVELAAVAVTVRRCTQYLPLVIGPA